MGLLLSVFAGTHVCPDGGESLARICRAKPFGRSYQAAFFYFISFYFFQQCSRSFLQHCNQHTVRQKVFHFSVFADGTCLHSVHETVCWDETQRTSE